MTTSTRDRAVDVARLGALVVVIFGHCALLLATVDSDGVHIDNLIGELPAIAPATWLAQVMPLFFLAGGAAGAYGFRPGTPWGAWLFTRAQRLFRPVFWYLAAWSAGLLAARLILGADSAAGLGAESVALLWFLGVYVATLAFVPVLVRLSSGRAVAFVLVGLVSATTAVDVVRFAVGNPAAGLANFLIVWLIPVTIGVAYARGLISVRCAAVVTVAAIAAQLALVLVGPYEVSLVVTGAERVSNVSPPTLLLAVHCVWMSCAFVVLAGAIARWAQRPAVWRVVSAGNAGAMTIYLWHIVAIAIAAFSLSAFDLDAYDVAAHDFWLMLALRAIVFAVVMLALFGLLSPLERRPLPWWDAPVAVAGARSTAAGVLVCVAGVLLVAMAKFGLGDPVGWSALGAFLVLAVAARLAAATPAAVAEPATVHSKTSSPKT